MIPGNVLYLPLKGIVHSATTAVGLTSITHAMVGLVQETLKYGNLLMAGDYASFEVKTVVI
jgi:hypothetical protein